MSNSLTSFVSKAKKQAEAANRLTGRLLFALDASGSREHTWAMSRKLTLPIFTKLKDLGDLSVSLGYFNGGDAKNGFVDQCQFSDYVSDPQHLIQLMNLVQCMSCNTQIGKVLDHAALEALRPGSERPSAMIYIGDDMEENLDTLLIKSRVLNSHKLPVFMFLENTSFTGATDRRAFKAIAEATGGAFAEFNEGAADKMAEFISSAVSFALGGLKALTKQANAGSEAARLLLTQIKK